MVMVLPVPRFTIDMLVDFPDDGNRYELLEGTLLVTPAPTWDHQVIATRLVLLLGNALGADAQVVAVGAIQRGKNTQLQPDILVVPPGYGPKANWRQIHGWWLAVEVMSPSSRIYDREVKRAAYLALGVQGLFSGSGKFSAKRRRKPSRSHSSTIRRNQQTNPHNRGKGAVDRPFRLPGHEAARNHVDSLKEKDAADQ